MKKRNALNNNPTHNNDIASMIRTLKINQAILYTLKKHREKPNQKLKYVSVFYSRNSYCSYTFFKFFKFKLFSDIYLSFLKDEYVEASTFKISANNINSIISDIAELCFKQKQVLTTEINKRFP